MLCPSLCESRFRPAHAGKYPHNDPVNFVMRPDFFVMPKKDA